MSDESSNHQTRGSSIEQRPLTLPSPVWMALFSYAFFLVAWLLPPSTYSYYLGEPNRLFLNAPAFLLFSLCVLAFCLGAKLSPLPRFLNRPIPIEQRKAAKPVVSEWIFVSLPLAVGTGAAILSSLLLLRSNPEVIALLIAGELGQEKNNLELEGTLGLAVPFLMGIIWWAIYRFDQIGGSVASRRIVKCLFGLAIVAVLISSSLKLARGEIMPIVVGIFVLDWVRRARRGEMSLTQMIRRFAGASSGLVGLFLTFSFLRGISDGDRLIRDILGYTVSSYNRLAAIVDGTLRYPYAGKGIYLSAFFSFNGTFNNLIPLQRIFEWPNFMDVWQSEFAATWNAGLYGYLIWSGAFGYIFSDLGWLSPLLLFAYGILYRILWGALLRGQVLGIVLYPWLAFCVFFWFGTNFLFDTKFFVLLFTGLVLAGYERLMGFDGRIADPTTGSGPKPQPNLPQLIPSFHPVSPT